MEAKLEMQKNIEDSPGYILFEGAEGAIQAHENQDTEVIDRLVDDLQTDNLFRHTDKAVPCKCIDGRTCEHYTEGPNAAGGTISIYVAEDLTSPIPHEDRGTVADGMRVLVDRLQADGQPVGAHGDNHHDNPDVSGCGANDKLSEIYELITRKPEVVKKYVEVVLGEGSVDLATEELIFRNARGRSRFSKGHEVFNVFQEATDADTEILDGEHLEVIAVVNMRDGETLDRQKVQQEYGSNYQVFCIDAWSFANAAELVADNEDDVRQKVIAMAYYNFATGLKLCGENMRVVIRR